ncbi:zinc ribbon domain-containing protein [Advenella sp. RU8]|uniref:zinc ribbon domain-containing protein n=1 Tax=Advenella sp. RU8 TaxID=3399575 RepID=UPI003AAC2AAA
MHCTNCGERLPDDAKFCGYCGTKIPTPFKAPAQSGQAAYSEPVNQPAAQKGKGIMKAIAGAAVVVMVIGAVLLIKPAFLSPVSESKPQAALSAQAETVQLPLPDTEPVKPRFADSKKVKENITERIKENTNVPVNGISLSTEARPTINDFRWFLDGVEKNGLPQGILKETDFNNLAASWKCLFIYDPEGLDTGRLYDFLTFTLSGAEGNGAIILDWSHMYAGDQDIDETTMEDTVLNMNWDKGTLYGYGPMNISIKQFYSYKGAQYAVGTLTLPDGTAGLVAMTRP